MPRKKKEQELSPFEIYDPQDRVHDVEYADIMQKSYIDYAMSVIVARALPDVRDGLKPVQRRILYDMKELGTTSDKPYRKSARIVGDTMGKYHPHGDSSIYGAMVVLAQDFKMGLPLVDGHGNFGSIEGDGAAAMRYTEARLQKLSETAVLADMDKDTVDFVPNFDETEKEPSVLPVRFPNFLVNGSEGIAVGMVTSTPTHNLREVIDASIAMIDDPFISNEELLEYVKGPDFPTGGIVANKSDLAAIYSTGTGKIKLRGKCEVEDLPGGKSRVIITQIPYTMIGAGIGRFLNDVAKLIEDRVLTGISDISNQSSKEGIRIVLELKKDVDAREVINTLYAKTKLEDTFGVNMLAIADGRPEVLSLKDSIGYSINFQYDLNTRKYSSILEQAEKRREIQEGLIKACDCIDLIIEILRGSRDRKTAKECMVNGVTDSISFKTKKSMQDAKRLQFTEAQADAILDMRLYKLIGLEVNALKKEYENTLKEIETCKDLLSNQSSMSALIKKEMKEIGEKYGTDRKTTIEDCSAAVYRAVEEKDEPAVVLIDRFGYAHTVDNATYERNADAAAEAYKYIIHTTSLGRIFIVTNTGQSHIVQVKDIPLGKLRDKGVPLDNISTYKSAEQTIVGIFDMASAGISNLLFCTRKGYVKFVQGSEFDVSRRSTAATKLSPEDEVAAVIDAHDADTIVMRTDKGYALRYKSDKVSYMKKTSVGVAGIALTKGDLVSSVYVLPQEGEEYLVGDGEEKLDLMKLRITGRNTRGSKL